MSNFPFDIDDDVTLPPVNNNITEIGAEAINAVRDAVFSIEKEIGIGAAGSAGSIAARLGVSLDAAGNIKPSAITSMGLVTLPIYNFHIAENAQILESKLKLDYRTSDLFNYIKDLVRDVNSSIGWINATGMKLDPHIFGALYRHELSHIDVNASSNNYLKNKFDVLRDNLNAFNLLNDINSELVKHQKLDGSYNTSSHIITDNGSLLPARYAHPASGIFLNTSRFSSIPQTAQDLQQFVEFIDSASIFLYGTRIQNLYSNGISKFSRSSTLTFDGYGQTIIPPTKATTYLLNGLSSVPVDNIDYGDDIIEFKPSVTELSNNTFDSKFQLVKAGDILRINYGSLETTFIIKEKKYIQNGSNKKFYVRINGKNLLATTTASARIDKPLVNQNKYGVLAVSAANNESSLNPSLIVTSPRSAMALGLGFNPNLIDSTHYLLYLAIYPTGNPSDGYTILPGIDITGNLGSTPGQYTLYSIIEATNNAFRKKGYNFRFNAFQYGGEFGIALDPYNNASFSIISGVVDHTGGYNQSGTLLNFPNNVVGVFGSNGKQAPDALGFGPNGSGVASPLPQSSYLTPEQAIRSTRVFVPLRRNTYYVDGTERDRLLTDIGQVLDVYGDGYWVATIDDVTQPSLTRVATKFRIRQDLSTSKLKAGKTIVVQGLNSSDGDIINYGRYVIDSVAFDACPDPITDIVVYDSVHGVGATPYPTLPVGSQVRLYFGSDSVGFNSENSSDITSVVAGFKRHFEVLADKNGDVITHERARFNAGGSNLTINGITLYSSPNLSNISLIKVSPKLRGYNFFSGNNSINKISLNIINFNSSSGSFDGYLASYDGTNLTRLGPITSGRIGEVIRFYDETNIDYIDLIFEFNNLGSFSNNIADIQLFPTLMLDRELLPLATCQLDDSTKKVAYIRDERQFGNVSEEELSTSAIQFINAGDRNLHENGVIRGFDLANDIANPVKEQISISGGVALVNGKLIQINNTITSIPIIKEKDPFSSVEYNINWALCINDKSELQSIPLLDYDSSFGTPNNPNRKFLARNLFNGSLYNLDAMTFSQIINKRKDLCILYIVSSTVTGSGLSTDISLSVTDARRYVNDEGSNLPLKLTSDKSQGNFRNPEAILNWIKFNSTFNSKAILKGANATINTGLNLNFSSTVYVDGENNGSLIFNAPITIGSNLNVKDLTLTFNQSLTITSAVNNLIFDHCTLIIDNVSAGSTVFNFNNANNVIFKDCTINVRYTSAPLGTVFNIENSNNINFINTSVSGIGLSPIFPGTSNQEGNLFNVNNSPGLLIDNCIFNGNFVRYMTISDSSNLQLKNSIITSSHIATNDSGWSSTDYVNSASGLIYSNIGATLLSDIIIDNCTFNFSPISASSNRWPIISFELSATTSILKNLVVKDCKFNNTNTGIDIVNGYIDDKRPAISIINSNASGTSTSNSSQPLLINADIVNNVCNRNQSIILSSKTDGSGIMTYPGLSVVNCNISGNICGTIGYWVSAGTRVNNVPTSTNYNSKGTGLIIYNNDCHYVTNVTSTGKFYQVSRPAQAISNITNSGGLIKVTTSGNHNLATGAVITISGVSGIPGINSTWTITSTSSNEFTLNGSVFLGSYTSGGQIDPINLSQYPSGYVVISNNRLNWIHTGISYEENSALTITKNILNAYDTNYVGAFGHTSNSNSGNTYNYAIAVGANYYQSSSNIPGPSNDSNVLIEGNIVNTGYYIDTNSVSTTYNYIGYVNCIASSIITNNIFKGVKEDINNSVCISVGGVSNIITNNKIYRSSKRISAYVKFANHILLNSTLSSFSYGSIVDNFFDKPTTDDSVNEQLVFGIPDKWTYERNKNQTGFMSIPLTNASFYSPFNAPQGQAYFFYVDADFWATSMPDAGVTYGRFGSNILRIYDNGNADRAIGLQCNISNYLPLNVRIIQLYSGVKPFGSVVTTLQNTNGAGPDSMFRVFLNKYKSNSTFANSYIATNGINTPPIINMDGLGVSSPSNNDTYGVENLTTNALYNEVTGGQINSTYTTLPIYINLENYTPSTTPSFGGVNQALLGSDQSSSFITGKGYEFSFSFAMKWKKTFTCNFGVAPVVVKYRW